MSDSIIIAELAIKSGTVITADLADGYDKEVMFDSGIIASPASEGTNHLFKSLKAAAYTAVQDLVELLNWQLEDAAAAKIACTPAI